MATKQRHTYLWPILGFSLLSGCAALESTQGFDTPADVLLPIRDYVYLGDADYACNDGTRGNLKYGSDRVLKICVADGWQPIIVRAAEAR